MSDYELPPLPEHWEHGLTEFVRSWGRAAIEADRKRRGEPVAASEAYDTIDSFLRNNLDDDDYALYSSALDDVYTTPQPTEPVSVPKQAEPSGYAYRYRYGADGTVLRFNNGGEVNGSRPIEAAPYWFAPPNATTVTCQLYGHPLKTCAECNHEWACSAKPENGPNICSEHCARDATRYRTLRNMPPGIRVQVHVGDDEWEDVCSGDELGKTLDSARKI